MARMISDNSYLWAWKLERNETLHICVQRGKSLQRVQSWSHWRWQSSWMWRIRGQKVRSTRHNAVRHDGQLVTLFYGVTSWLVPLCKPIKRSNSRGRPGPMREQLQRFLDPVADRQGNIPSQKNSTLPRPFQLHSSEGLLDNSRMPPATLRA